MVDRTVRSSPPVLPRWCAWAIKTIVRLPNDLEGRFTADVERIADEWRDDGISPLAIRLRLVGIIWSHVRNRFVPEPFRRQKVHPSAVRGLSLVRSATARMVGYVGPEDSRSLDWTVTLLGTELRKRGVETTASDILSADALHDGRRFVDLREIRHRVEAGDLDVVLVVSIVDLGLNLDDLERFVGLLDRHGATLISLDERIDTRQGLAGDFFAVTESIRYLALQEARLPAADFLADVYPRRVRRVLD